MSVEQCIARPIFPIVRNGPLGSNPAKAAGRPMTGFGAQQKRGCEVVSFRFAAISDLCATALRASHSTQRRTFFEDRVLKTSARRKRLFDDLVSASNDHLGNCKAKHLCGPEIQNKFNL